MITVPEPDPKCMLCKGTGWSTHVTHFDGRPNIETPCARCDTYNTGKIFRQLDTTRTHGMRLVTS